MLKELYIKNLAIIEEAVIPFGEHFNVFTGETGAGKSILINGINSVLGQRVTKDIVRSGCDKAVITAFFTDLSEECCQRLDSMGISHEEGQLTLSREIRSDGGSTARINGKATAVALLKEVTEGLVNIHGQHDNRILMETERHIDILDRFGGLEKQIEAYRQEFRELQTVSRRLRSKSIEYKEKRERADKLNEAVKEIGEAAPKEREDERLAEELSEAQNAEYILEGLYFAGNSLNGEEGSAAEIISQAKRRLEDLSDLTDRYAALTERLESVRIELVDIAEEIERSTSGIDNDPGRLAALSARSDTLEYLKDKYGPDLEDVRKHFESAKAELAEQDDLSSVLEELTAKRTELLHRVSVKAKELSAERERTAERFAEAVEGELSFLDMPGVKIKARITHGNLTEKGMDSVEFLISANRGEELRPLAKIASGGELSRIMLALKNVIPDEAHTMIFDEIDTGVSGRAAQKIAVKLKNVSRSRQVLCVTHLPQIAAAADDHLLIEKKSDDSRTYTHVTPLDREGRRKEIARIMVGESITPTALENADELMDSFERSKT